MLCTDNVIKDGLDYGQSDLKINDEGLECCIMSWYEVYRLPYKRSKGDKCTKFNEQVYNGSREDMKLDMLIELYKLFEDTTFCPTTNAEIYSRLKYNTINTIGENIDTSCLSKSDIVYDDDGEEYSLLDIVKDNEYTNLDKDYYYNGVMLEIADIVHNFDVKLLLKKDAYVQRNVIDIIYKYYDYRYNEQSDECELPKQSEMIEYYKTEFGTKITQSQYSRALSDIFKAICNCTISLKGVDIKRDFFIDKETKIYDIQKLQCE